MLRHTFGAEEPLAAAAALVAATRGEAEGPFTLLTPFPRCEYATEAQLQTTLRQVCSRPRTARPSPPPAPTPPLPLLSLFPFLLRTPHPHASRPMLPGYHPHQAQLVPRGTLLVLSDRSRGVVRTPTRTRTLTPTPTPPPTPTL